MRRAVSVTGNSISQSHSQHLSSTSSLLFLAVQPLNHFSYPADIFPPPAPDIDHWSSLHCLWSYFFLITPGDGHPRSHLSRAVGSSDGVAFSLFHWSYPHSLWPPAHTLLVELSPSLSTRRCILFFPFPSSPLSPFLALLAPPPCQEDLLAESWKHQEE